MIPLNSGRKLQVVLAGAITTNQLQCSVSYTDRRADGVRSEGLQTADTNSTTDVDVCSAPKSGDIRIIDSVMIYNKDTVDATVILKIDDGGAETILIRTTLAPNETLVYEDE